MGEKVRKRYLLTLCRQDIGVESVGSNSNYSSFILDYFDKMEVREIEKEDLAGFLGIGDQSNIFAGAVALQNYAIYRDEAENDPDIFSIGSEYPYIGLIHVYITPDVIAGIDLKEYDYISKFEQELEELTTKCNEEICIAKVFRMLSASDYMIVVRSNQPEAAFSLSNYIREKVILKKDTKECLAAFKTYSIFGVYNIGNIEGLNTEKESITAHGFGANSGIVIRGRYSNQYWTKKKDGTLKLPLLKDEDLKSLYGRYDFCIYLTMTEFADLYEELKWVKGFGGNKPLSDKTASKKVEYLRVLMKENCLSYINERFFVSKLNPTEILVSPSSEEVGTIGLKADYCPGDYMAARVSARCEELLHRVDLLKESWQEIVVSKNSFDKIRVILMQLIYLCSSANNISEIRIYVISMVQQLETVMDTIENWTKVYNITKSLEFLTFFEVYLRKAIVAMDTYGSVIRDNNFQTLQSPRYETVSGCSLEKILIAYGAFLDIMMDFCRMELKNGLEKTEHLPVVVPSLGNDSMSVEILFPEWVCDSAIQYGQYGKIDFGTQKFLTLITGPATEELVNVPYIVTTLFHEMAHRLRYESREERNVVLIRTMVLDVAEAVVNNLFKVMEQEDIAGDTTDQIQVFFEEAIESVILEMFFDDLQSDDSILKDGSGLSLESFKYFLQDTLNDMILSFQRYEPSIYSDIRNFVEDTSEFIVNSDENLSCIRELYDVAKLLDELLKATDYKKINEDLEHELEVGKKVLFNSMEKYKNNCIKSIDDSDKKHKKENIADALENFTNAVIRSIEKCMPMPASVFEDQTEKFYENLYMRCCSMWMEKFSKNEFYADMKEWLRAGRLFGIDFQMEDNQKRFSRYMAAAFRAMDSFSFGESMLRIELYREETSDLFMCNMCDLDLSSYLTLSSQMDIDKSGEYYNGQVIRFADVILIQWLIEDEEWKDTSVELIKKNLYREFENLWKKLSGKEESIQDEQQLMDCLLKIVNDTKVEYKRNIVRLAVQILNVLPQRISWFENQKWLLNDFLRGRRTYQFLHKKFVESAKKEHIIVKEICEITQKFLAQFGHIEDEEMNKRHEKACEDFLMKAYCYHKLRKARE